MNPWQGLSGAVARPRSTYTIAPERKRATAPKPVRDNPWDLTPAECRALDLLIKTGSNDEVSRLLGIETNTLEQHLRSARKRIGAPNRLLMALAWDRFQRTNG